MGPGAIIVVGAKGGAFAQGIANSAASRDRDDGALFADSLETREILGRSVPERLVERYLEARVEFVSVLLDEKIAATLPRFRSSFKNVTVHVVRDVQSAIAARLDEYSALGIEHSFIHSAAAYAENDLMDLFYFHREARQMVTRAFDYEGPLPLWVVDCVNVQGLNVDNLLQSAGPSGSSYFIRELAHRLEHPRDLRQLAVDMLNKRCQKGPSGREVRPGVWIDHGAEVHRRARIVAPAYIGRDCEIEEDALITRDSALEQGCRVGLGTVIEGSSVLAHTDVGMWLDVCRAVVNGNKIFSLEHDVLIEIADPGVLRSAVPVLDAPSVLRPRNENEEVRTRNDSQRAPGLRPGALPPRAWQLGTNLIQE